MDEFEEKEIKRECLRKNIFQATKKWWMMLKTELWVFFKKTQLRIILNEKLYGGGKKATEIKLQKKFEDKTINNTLFFCKHEAYKHT